MATWAELSSCWVKPAAHRHLFLCQTGGNLSSRTKAFSVSFVFVHRGLVAAADQRGATMQSSTPVVASTTQAARVAQAYMKIAGVGSIKELQELSMAKMLDAQTKLFET